MGTWAVPKTKEDFKKLERAIATLINLKDSLYLVMGNDDLFDHFDGAIQLIREQSQTLKSA